jgi:hypothetical protein
MATILEIFNEYVRMRENGLEPKEALKPLRSYIEPHANSDKERLAQELRSWEREHLDRSTTAIVDPIPDPPENVRPLPNKGIDANWVECVNCHKKNRVNEIFCYACGQLLDPGQGKSADTHHFADATESLFSDDFFGDDSVLTFIVRDTGERFEVRPQLRRHELVIGRSAGAGSMNPDIDLIQVDGAQFGVSRLHMAIRYEAADSAVHVYDLGSANGSFVNGQKLHPKEIRILRNGDEVRLGRLVLRIQYQHPGERV